MIKINHLIMLVFQGIKNTALQKALPNNEKMGFEIKLVFLIEETPLGSYIR